MRTADLLRFVDGEGNAAFRERVTAHLADCADCTAVTERLRADTAHVLSRLRALDEATAADKLPATFAELAQRGSRGPAAARVVGWRRAAVIILFLGVGAAIARPAAAWLSRLIDNEPAAEDVTTLEPRPTPERSASTPAETTSAAYSFTPASHELRIDFAAAEPDAELVVRAYDETVASFELHSIAPLPAVMILPNGIRITNGTNRGTRYELALPRHVDVVIVSIAGGAAQRIVAGSLPARIRVTER